MRKNGVALALMLSFLAPVVHAEGIPATPPKPRPAGLQGDLIAVVSTSNVMGISAAMRPRPRPADLAVAMDQGPEIDADSVVELSAMPALPMLRPIPRPAGFAASAPEAVIEPAVAYIEPATPETPQKKTKNWSLFKTAAVRNPQSPESLMPKKGSVCGDPSIRGRELAPVVSRVKGCGIEAPVEVTQIAGVRFSQPATITCETAAAAKDWIEQGLQPAFSKDPVKMLQIAGSYVCRPRNGIRGNKISEHGRGKALDVSGFTLESGKTLSVAGDYRRSKPMKAAYKSGCGPFGTTLGPGSDGHHEDHLHFDIARQRYGNYCR